MRPHLLIGFILINFLHASAQRSLLSLEEETPAVWAVRFFQQGRTDLSCSQFFDANRVKDPDETNKVGGPASRFYSLACRLQKKQSAAEQEAIRFLKENNIPVWL
ncbi:MAG: hypothetical protein ACK5BZ_01055, partial [Bacteroidota bacterium]